MCSYRFSGLGFGSRSRARTRPAPVAVSSLPAKPIATGGGSATVAKIVRASAVTAPVALTDAQKAHARKLVAFTDFRTPLVGELRTEHFALFPLTGFDEDGDETTVIGSAVERVLDVVSPVPSAEGIAAMRAGDDARVRRAEIATLLPFVQ